MENTIPFIDKINAFLGIAIAVLSYIFGEHWYLFVAFLGLNVVDEIVGTMNARKKGVVSSSEGIKGITKKFGYWLMIAVAFAMSGIFIEIGDAIRIDLRITTLIGWFVLASLIINELRSIIENFVELGYNVPVILTKGLEVADKALEAAEEAIDDDKKEGDQNA